jgi:hypothetical protein
MMPVRSVSGVDTENIWEIDVFCPVCPVCPDRVRGRRALRALSHTPARRLENLQGTNLSGMEPFRGSYPLTQQPEPERARLTAPAGHRRAA